MRKQILLTTIIFATCLPAGAKYEGSTFNEVWNAVKAKPNEPVPPARVTTVAEMLLSEKSLAENAKRTLENKFDLFLPGSEFPPARKLAHPHGICYRGTWKIDTDTGFTGLFAKSTEVPILVRASEAMGYVHRGNFRAFGLAGKLFPGVEPSNPNSLEKVRSQTADFFTMNDFAGTKIDQFFKSSFTNAPPVSLSIRTSPNVIALGAFIGATFIKADKNPNIRQLYPLSESTLEDISDAVTPGEMRLVGDDFIRIKPNTDFREESRLANYEKNVVFQIELRASSSDDWNRAGTLSLEEDALSLTCDEWTHFLHPKWK